MAAGTAPAVEPLPDPAAGAPWLRLRLRLRPGLPKVGLLRRPARGRQRAQRVRQHIGSGRWSRSNLVRGRVCLEGGWGLGQSRRHRSRRPRARANDPARQARRRAPHPSRSRAAQPILQELPIDDLGRRRRLRIGLVRRRQLRLDRPGSDAHVVSPPLPLWIQQRRRQQLRRAGEHAVARLDADTQDVHQATPTSAARTPSRPAAGSGAARSRTSHSGSPPPAGSPSTDAPSVELILRQSRVTRLPSATRSATRMAAMLPKPPNSSAMRPPGRSARNIARAALAVENPMQDGVAEDRIELVGELHVSGRRRATPRGCASAHGRRGPQKRRGQRPVPQPPAAARSASRPRSQHPGSARPAARPATAG